MVLEYFQVALGNQQELEVICYTNILGCPINVMYPFTAFSP